MPKPNKSPIFYYFSNHIFWVRLTSNIDSVLIIFNLDAMSSPNNIPPVVPPALPSCISRKKIKYTYIYWDIKLCYCNSNSNVIVNCVSSSKTP